MIKVVALARALADAGEHRITAVRLGDVIDQFHDQHGLADTGAAEQADLAALGIRREQINHLDACRQNLRFRRLLDIFGSGLMDRAFLLGLYGASLVYRFANDVDNAAERFAADRHRNRLPRIGDGLSAHKTFG